MRYYLMEEHGQYFQEQFAAGRILLFGPVMATDGAFGLAVLGKPQFRDLLFPRGKPRVCAIGVL